MSLISILLALTIFFFIDFLNNNIFVNLDKLRFEEMEEPFNYSKFPEVAFYLFAYSFLFLGDYNWLFIIFTIVIIVFELFDKKIVILKNICLITILIFSISFYYKNIIVPILLGLFYLPLLSYSIFDAFGMYKKQTLLDCHEALKKKTWLLFYVTLVSVVLVQVSAFFLYVFSAFHFGFLYYKFIDNFQILPLLNWGTIFRFISCFTMIFLLVTLIVLKAKDKKKEL